MWLILKNWLTGNALRLLGYGAVVFSVAAVLFGAHQAGRSAERVDQLKKIVEIKDGLTITNEQFAEYIMERTDVWFFYIGFFIAALGSLIWGFQRAQARRCGSRGLPAF